MKKTKKALVLLLAAVLVFTGCKPAALGTGQAYTVYGMKFNVDDGYPVGEYEENGIHGMLVTFLNDNYEEFGILFVYQPSPTGWRLEDSEYISQAYAESMGAGGIIVTIEEVKETTIMGLPALRFTFFLKNSNGVGFKKHVIWVVIENETFYGFEYIATWDNYDEYLPKAERIIGSLEWLGGIETQQ